MHPFSFVSITNHNRFVAFLSLHCQSADKANFSRCPGSHSYTRKADCNNVAKFFGHFRTPSTKLPSNMRALLILRLSRAGAIGDRLPFRITEMSNQYVAIFALLNGVVIQTTEAIGRTPAIISVIDFVKISSGFFWESED